jgi:hypothetical protein
MPSPANAQLYGNRVTAIFGTFSWAAYTRSGVHTALSLVRVERAGASGSRLGFNRRPHAGRSRATPEIGVVLEPPRSNGLRQFSFVSGVATVHAHDLGLAGLEPPDRLRGATRALGSNALRLQALFLRHAERDDAPLRLIERAHPLLSYGHGTPGSSEAHRTVDRALRSTWSHAGHGLFRMVPDSLLQRCPREYQRPDFTCTNGLSRSHQHDSCRSSSLPARTRGCVRRPG